MSASSNRALYYAWVRTVLPQVYAPAIQAAHTAYTARKRSGMGGMGDDASDAAADDAALQQALSDPTAWAGDYAGSSSSSGNSAASVAAALTAFANAGGSIANTITLSEAQQNLLAINTQRAQQGLPPLTSNGQIVTASMLASGATGLESMLAGGSSGILLLLLGVGLLFVLAGNHRGGSAPAPAAS